MDEKLYIQDIIDAFVEKQGMQRAEAEIFVKAIFDIIKDALVTDKIVKVKGLGTFKLTEVDSRESVNVNTGERIRIESHTKISFVPDMQMRDLINKPFSHFETVVLNDGVNFEDMPVVSEDEDKEDSDELPELPEKIQEEVLAAEIDTSVEQKDKPVELPKEEDTPFVEEPEQEKDTSLCPESDKEKLTKPIPCDVPEKEELIALKSHHLTLLYRIGIALICIPLLCGVIFYVYNKEILKEKTYTEADVKQFIKQLEDTKLPEEDMPIMNDTLQATPTAQPEKIDTTKTVITGVRKGSNSVKADSTSYVIVGTMSVYKIGAGETLTMVSKRFYETKDLWPYIVMHNRNVIKNPNRVPSGTVVRIPALRDKVN